ncbi:hypothetical protein AB4Z54_37085, partial [Streptomyces sp. MCAF7]
MGAPRRGLNPWRRQRRQPHHRRLQGRDRESGHQPGVGQGGPEAPGRHWRGPPGPEGERAAVGPEPQQAPGTAVHRDHQRARVAGPQLG